MFERIRRLPYLRVLAVAQLALVARRHLQALTPAERRRMSELARRGRHLDDRERRELRDLAGKLEPGAFAGAVADAFSPVPLPGRRGRTKARRR
jgi:hypothetical protein